MKSKPGNTVSPDPEIEGQDQSTQRATSQKARVEGNRAAKGAARQTPEPARRKRGTKSVADPKPAARLGTPKNTKAELILKKLRTAKGVSIEMLIADTGWQAHSVRDFLSAVVKKKLALNLVSGAGKDGVRRYRIASDTQSA